MNPDEGKDIYADQSVRLAFYEFVGLAPQNGGIISKNALLHFEVIEYTKTT